MRLCVECGGSLTGADWVCAGCGWTAPRRNGFPSLTPAAAGSIGGFNPDAFQQLVDVEGSSFWFRSRNRLLLWALRKYFPSIQNFLEIGCGTGFVLSGIASDRPALRLAGSEGYSEGLELASKRLPKSVDLLQMDARRVPFDAEFDAIGMFDVIEHIREDEAVLREVHRALRPGGGLLITVPQHQFLWSEADESAQHVRRYSSRDLREKIERAGFRVARMTSFVSLLLPLMLLSRRGRTTKEGIQNSELALSKWTDTILDSVMRVEMVLIKVGFDWPLGGSLLVVARKESP